MPHDPSSQRSTTMRKRVSLATGAVAAASALLLAGCTAGSSTTPSTAPGTSLLAEHNLDGLDAREIIERLDALPITDRPDDLIASIQPDQLVLTDQQENETTLPMPADEFYVSVAPYAEQTHECYFHSLTTCLGELGNTDVQVTVTDTATGEIVLEDTLTTYDNGFVGLWLPRDIDATLTLTADGRTATQNISTRADDPTCLTTLQLT